MDHSRLSLPAQQLAVSLTRRATLGIAPALAGVLTARFHLAEAKKKGKKRKTPPPALPAGCGQYACLVRTWGTEGTGNAQFGFPNGIAVAANGDVYVGDESNSCIQRFSANGEFLLQWGRRGSANGEFLTTRGVAIAPNGNVYVADSGNDRVQWFTPTGAFLGAITRDSIPTGTFPETEPEGPGAIAIGPSGTVYVGTRYNRILRFTAAGAYFGWWGGDGTDPGKFDSLERIAIGMNGDVYVTDEGLARVQRFNASGSFLGLWGGRGSGDGQFLRPWGIAADAAGNIYVADVAADCIQAFSPTGVLLGKLGTLGSSPGEFVSPTDVAIGPNGNIYVTDAGNHRVQQFAFPAPPPPPQRKKKKKKKR